MGGATVTPMEGSGTFGRFRVIPGTDQVVLVNAADQNVFIGTVPFDGSQPAPSPTPAPVSTGTLTGQFLGVTGEDKVAGHRSCQRTWTSICACRTSRAILATVRLMVRQRE